MPSLRLRAIKKKFGAQSILKGIDLDVNEGEFAVLVGPSGCGKSTLLRTVAGLESPDEGTLVFGDRDVTHAAPRDRDIAMVFQSYALYPHMRVKDNIAFGLRLRGVDAKSIATRVDEVSAMLGLGALLDRYPRELSGGQRQRVAMGRAIARRPALFLFDEPLSNLDAALRGQVRVEIKRLHAQLGATMIYVTHDQVEAMTLADRLVVLNGGVIEQQGAPLEVYHRPATRFVAGFLGSPAMNFLDAKITPDGSAAACDGLALPLESERFGRLEPGREVVVGVRPHDVVTTASEGTAPIELKVDVVEAMGFESFAYGHVGATTFVARLDGAARLPARGERVGLGTDVANVYLFDRATGRSLDTSARRA